MYFFLLLFTLFYYIIIFLLFSDSFEHGELSIFTQLHLINNKFEILKFFLYYDVITSITFWNLDETVILYISSDISGNNIYFRKFTYFIKQNAWKLSDYVTFSSNLIPYYIIKNTRYNKIKNYSLN